MSQDQLLWVVILLCQIIVAVFGVAYNRWYTRRLWVRTFVQELHKEYRVSRIIGPLHPDIPECAQKGCAVHLSPLYEHHSPLCPLHEYLKGKKFL